MSLGDLNEFAARLRGFIDDAGARIDSAMGFDKGGGSFQSLALELFSLQFRHNELYQRFCKSRGFSPRNIENWAQIPAIPTAGFKELALSSLPVDTRTRVFHSSGTTGHRPSRHFHCAESLSVYEASLWPWFASHLLPELSLLKKDCPANGAISLPKALAMLTPPAAQVPNSSLVYMFDAVARRFGPAVCRSFGTIGVDAEWVLNSSAAIDFLQSAVETSQPVVLLGTAFSFVHLLDGLADSGRRMLLPAGSRVLETGGYKGQSRSMPKAQLHGQMENLLGIPRTHIVCEYGMSELSSQAYEGVCGGFSISMPRDCAHTDREVRTETGSRAFVFPPWTRAEVISPETGAEVAEGEMGLIRIFNLANVYSVMAIQTEDLGIRRGHAFELIARKQEAEARGCSLMSADVYQG